MEVGAVLVILVALAFDFTNGFHDAANSIATVVSTRVLSPRYAVAWAAFFNFAAFLVFGTEVATTIAKDVVDPSLNVLTVGVVFAGLIGAIGWNLITFYLGLPTSSSHALVGGMAGAAVAKAGFDVLQEPGLRKIGVFIVLSPLIGLALGLILSLIILWTFRRARRIELLNRGFRRGQLVSAAAFSLGHGANDAQKTMGIILAVLIAGGQLQPDADVPLWVILAAHTAIGLGTLSGGGGIPVSTTQTITGAIVGVGATRRLSAVRWGVAGQVVWAWVLTIPGAFTIAWVSQQIMTVAT
ncbi:MAG: inorganic phosphate transporter [Actinobacteria bacterium]|nr:inorganic phosphate transporter [Actinomycetota bacterium]